MCIFSGDNRYKKEDRLVVYDTAIAQCRAYGADLVSIHSKEEQGNYTHWRKANILTNR